MTSRRSSCFPLGASPFPGSEGASWGRHGLRDGCERFFRSSTQRGWLNEERGLVLEDVFLNHAEQRILFLGRETMESDTGRQLHAGTHQSLFHVEHAAGGTQDEPLNLWRVVIFSDGPDPRLTQLFEQMVKAGLLPGFLEIYIERDLGVRLSRR